jgi:hypothetical protein
MKHLKWFFLCCFILFATALGRANPIMVYYFNELTFDSTKWILEIDGQHLPLETGLDGYYLSSKTDTALFKAGLVLNSYLFYIITQDSMQSPFFMDPDGDRIRLLSPDLDQYGWLPYGNTPGSYIPSPQLGQSISILGDSYYLDNSPTIGLPNDTSNAMGNIISTVTDSSGTPLEGVQVFHEYAGELTKLIAATDNYGSFSLRWLACSFSFWLEKPNYQTKFITVQVYPESTVTLNITMDTIQAVNGRTETGAFGKYQLLGNYPNPFNAETKISYELPSEGIVTLKIYDITGKLVKTLANVQQEAGVHNVLWDGSSSDGKLAASGIYICQIEFTGSNGKRYLQSKKMSLVN